MGREVHVRLPQPPDPAPARRLAELLRDRRASGRPWPTNGEFNRMAALAVAFVDDPNERVAWREVLSEQRDHVWQLAYERQLEVRRGLMS